MTCNEIIPPPLVQLHTTEDLDGALIQPSSKLQQILQFVLVSRHLFFPLVHFLVLLQEGEKKELEGNGIFGSHNMNTAQHCPNTCSLHPSMDS